MKFWKNRKVFITGHTGFKGSWLSLWLNYLGADVTGYALEAPTNPSMFEICDIGKDVNSIIADIRDISRLKTALKTGNSDTYGGATAGKRILQVSAGNLFDKCHGYCKHSGSGEINKRCPLFHKCYHGQG